VLAANLFDEMSSKSKIATHSLIAINATNDT